MLTFESNIRINLNLIDTHVHLYSKEYTTDLQAVLDRAEKAHIGLFFMPNIDINSLPLMLEIAKKKPKTCFPMLGLHPCAVAQDWSEQLDSMEKLLEQEKWIALGEIGIDLYHETIFKEEQLEALERQLNWAKKYDLPIVFHVRKGLDEVLSVLQKFSPFRFRGVFHCFGGSLEEVKKIQKLGDFKFGIGGIVTFKNSHLAAILPKIGIDHLVLETDGPYLAPVPFRGKRNEPAYILDIAVKLAAIFNLSIEEIAQKTTENAKRIFKID